MEKHLRCRCFPRCRHCRILTLSGKTVASEYKRKAVWVFFFLVFSLLCFILFALVCEGGWEREGEDVLKLRSTTVIVDAWYAQLVVYYCQQQVCVSLLTFAPPPPPTPHNWPTARLLAGVVGVALLFLSRRQPSKHLQQCRKRTHSKHNTAQRENIIKHECFEGSE